MTDDRRMPMPALTRHREWLGVGAIIGALALIQTWATARYGLGMTPDSFAYAGTADWIADGRGWGYWLEPELTTWPLGYPAVIAAVKFLSGTEAREAARIVQIVLLAASCLAAWRLAVRAITGRLLRLAAVAAFGASTLVGTLNRHILAETMLGLVALVTSVVLADHVTHRRRWPAWVLPVLTSAAFLTSYRGGYVLVAAVVTTWLFDRDPIGRRTARAAVLAGACLVVPIAYAVLNRVRSDRRYQGSSQVDLSVARVPVTGAKVLAAWTLGRPDLSPSATAARPVALLAWSFLLGAVVVCGLVILRVRPSLRSAAAASAAFAGLMFAMIVASRWFTTFDLDHRTLSAAFGPLLIGVIGLASAGISSLSIPGRVRPAVGAVAFGWTAVVVGLGLSSTIQFHDRGGATRTGEAYRSVVEELRAIEVGSTGDCTIYATDPLLSWLAGDEYPRFRPGDQPARPFCVIDAEGSLQTEQGLVLIHDGPSVDVFRSD